MLGGVDNSHNAVLVFESPKQLSYWLPHPEVAPPMALITPFDNYLDLVEAARELAIHPQSLRRLIKQKKIPATLFAGKYLIERDKLEMFKSNYDPRPGRKPIRRLL